MEEMTPNPTGIRVHLEEDVTPFDREQAIAVSQKFWKNAVDLSSRGELAEDTLPPGLDELWEVTVSRLWRWLESDEECQQQMDRDVDLVRAILPMTMPVEELIHGDDIALSKPAQTTLSILGALYILGWKAYERQLQEELANFRGDDAHE